MMARMKHTAGFTLAELMMSIAIVLILAAIALPSIFSAQSNMRMVELDNAAHSIANAAQAEMTAMKVSGTWLGFLDARTGESKDANYLLRDEARSAGFITPTSIDETVYAGDYVIVFDRDTASVTEVYYADGKSGFFGSAPASTTAAQDYYAKGAGSSNAEDRRSANPMIGYYSGTAAGATSAVALSNPVIWVEDRVELKGLLCVQDPNVTGHPEWKSKTELAISKKDAEGNTVSFSIGGLDGTAAATVSAWVDAGDQTVYRSYTSEASSKPILQRIDRSGNAGGDVYAIDLNALVRAVAADTSQESAALLAELQKFTSGDTVRVDATVSTANPPSVDAHASANIEWPTQVAKLSVFVTNPNSKDVGAKPAHITGTYVDPAFDTLAENGSGALEKIHVPDSADNELTALSVNQSLGAENAQAMAQSYAGAWVDMGQASRIKASLQATAGSYKPNANTAHQYQVWELWVKQSNSEYTRAGYMRDNVWEWYDYAALGDCITWLKADGTSVKGNIAGTNAQDIVSVTVDVQALQAKLANELSNLADDTGSVEIYLRTAPKASEVQEHFNAKASTGVAGALAADYLSDDGVESASRRTNGTASAKARAVFENEFGASSSDVAWVVSREARSGDFSQANDFLAEGTNIRVYYSIAPGLGFKNIKEFQNGNLPSILSSVRSTQMTNVALWLYRSDEAGALKAMPEAMLISDGASPYTCRHGNDASNNNLYDFKLTTQEDYRFYRVLTYYEDAQVAEDPPVKLDIPSQYVPHIATKDAIIAQAPDKTVDGIDYEFVGWKTADVRQGDEITIKFEGADPVTVGSLDSVLSYTGTALTAVYVEKPKSSMGLMYMEIGDGKAITGYYGYLPGVAGTVGSLPQNNAIASSGYYVVVPSGNGHPSIQEGPSVQGAAIEFNYNGSTYYAYELKTSNAWRMKDGEVYNPQIACSYQDPKTKEQFEGTFYVNFNFAAAVTNDKAVADAWGTASGSPWNVRTPSQFVGSFPANGRPNIQSVYATGYHQQSHHIDLSNVDRSYKFNTVFSGSYDGGGCEITGFDRAYYFYNQNAEQGFSVSDATGKRQGQGLFPYVQGSETARASLKNITLVAYDDAKTHGTKANAYFGFLVGVAEYTDIDACVLKGNDPSKKRVIELHDVSQNNGTLGGLAGLLENGSMTNSSVQGIQFELSCSQSQWGAEMNLGGLVGYAKGSNMSSCNVDNMQIMVAQVSKKHLYLGGLAGTAESVTENAGTVENLYFKLAYGQNLGDCSPGTLFGRTLSGSRENNTCTNVTYSVDDRYIKPVVEEVGSLQ